MCNTGDIEAELVAAYREGCLADLSSGGLQRPWADVLTTLLRSVPEPVSGPALLISGPDGNRTIDLSDVEVYLGRDPACTVCLPYRFVSRRHCRLQQEDERWILEDLGSSNGTLVNGVPCTRKRLISGDILQIGEATILFLSPETDFLPKTPP